MEIDHIFICVKPGAYEAEALQEFGLTEGAANQHPGQGTACRRFFFLNAFLECLFLEDPDAAQSALTQPTQLYERLTTQSDDVSPFGVCFRPASDNETHAPFPSWRYTPAYVPEHVHIDVGEAPLTEPMWFFMSFAARPDNAPRERQQPFEHAQGFREMTALRMVLPKGHTLSEPARCAANVEGVEIVEGNGHLLALGFDHERHGQSHDFRPTLPLVFRW